MYIYTTKKTFVIFCLVIFQYSDSNSLRVLLCNFSFLRVIANQTNKKLRARRNSYKPPELFQNF